MRIPHWALNSDELGYVGQHRPPERAIVIDSWNREFLNSCFQRTLCSKEIAFKLVAEVIGTIIAFYINRDGNLGPIFGGKLQFDAVGLFVWGS
jgi:hypothetical protein